MKKLCLLFLTSFILLPALGQESTKDAFHFNSYKLTPESQISAAKLNQPITENQRIKLSSDGHLEANGKRVRIFGTNLSEFPTSHQQADFYAQALANQGYNCIRFHHTDANWTNCFLKKDSTGKWVINQQRLDDFDYFFSKLKEKGIYSNINFLTGRSMSSADGYKKEIDLYKEWKTCHSLGFWDKDALSKQQEYASQLMNHINPYTGMAYKDDPAVAIVEINNENGFLMSYLNDWLEPCTGEYWQELELQWNQWLAQQNITFEQLDKKYNRRTPDNKFIVDKNSKWNLEQHSGAKASVTNKKSETVIKIEKNGAEAWHIQYNCAKLSFNSDKIYTIKFSAKASKNGKVNISLMQAHDPWHNSGFNKNLDLTTTYKDYVFTVENIDTDDNLRLNFGSMGLSKGTTFCFKNIEVIEGGAIEHVIQKLDGSKKIIAFPHHSEYSVMPDELKNLVMEFLWEKEQTYWLTMRDFVRNDLKSQALIMGTAAGCSTSVLQSCFDIIDSHAYWNHPVFPAESWNMNNFYVKNADLTRADGNSTLTNLAKYRIYGKPFSVSEYDHPYPNQFNSQDYPMLASFASFQDWDCLFTFCSEIPKTKDGQNTKINGYFDQSNNPAKSCASPLASRIFRQFLVQSAPTKVSITLTEESEKEKLCKMNAWAIGNPELFGSNPQVSLKYQLGINLKGTTPAAFITTDISLIDATLFPKKFTGYDETNQIYWDQLSGIYRVYNDNVSISIMNEDSVLNKNEEYFYNGLMLPALPKNNSDFICIMGVKDILSQNEPYLIYSCSWVGNSKEKLHEYNTTNTSKTVIRNPDCSVTTAPSLGIGPVLALGSDAYIYINSKEQHKLYKTGLEGNKTQEIPCQAAQNYWSFPINSADSTLWYVLE